MKLLILIAGMDYLFDFFQGEVTSKEMVVVPIVYEDNEYGHKIKKIISFFNVSTDNQKYHVFFWNSLLIQTILIMSVYMHYGLSKRRMKKHNSAIGQT